MANNTGPWHALIDCYGQYRRLLHMGVPQQRSQPLFKGDADAWYVVFKGLTAMANTAGPWHALIDCYDQHRRYEALPRTGGANANANAEGQDAGQ